jgi:hypothetical protein
MHHRMEENRMNSLYRVRQSKAKPIKCIALGNPTFDTKGADFEYPPLP